ncbi:MAG: DUF4276 family protein [Methylococcaceae bacterium]|nr:DUF4276 family protein [Methylococcaceae bacterium]
MVRLCISVEGDTELRFVHSCFVPYFAQKNIFVTPVSLRGNISVDRVSHELKKLLYNYDVVTTLYDFYGFKNLKEGETKDSLEERILKSVPEELRNKLIPYIQMYEFEGLLFSSPSAMANILQKKELELWAQNILDQFNGNPESINDSTEAAPSKRLAETSYRKTTHGPNIMSEIGLDEVRQKCKGFDGWLSLLENLH